MLVSKFKDQIRSLVGITHQVEDPEIRPFFPDSKDELFSGTIGRIVKALEPIIKSKSDIYQIYSKLQEYHLVESLLTKVSSDIINKGKAESETFIKVEYEDNPEIDRICKDLIDKFKVEDHISENLFDMLLYGQYYLYNDFVNTQIDDRFEYMDILPVYCGGEIVKILKYDSRKKSYIDSEIDPSEVIILTLPSRRVKLKIKSTTGSKYYTKVPSPFIPVSVVRLINYLSLMETLIPISQLMQIERGHLVNVSVPSGTPIDQMFEICREYEKRINSRSDKMVSINSMEDVEEVIKNYGKYKAVPSIGNDKASASIKDLPESRGINKEDRDYLISVISDRTNAPQSYIRSESDRGTSEGEVPLQYLLEIIRIRKLIAESIKGFILNYFESRKSNQYGNLALDPSKLKVHTPTIPGTESLAQIDYIDSMSGTLSNVQRIIDDWHDMMTKYDDDTLDKDSMVKNLNDKLEPVMGGRIWKKAPPQKEDNGRGF